eukprot:1681007-Pyramimonas_sp.AAC.1
MAEQSEHVAGMRLTAMESHGRVGCVAPDAMDGIRKGALAAYLFLWAAPQCVQHERLVAVVPVVPVLRPHQN